VHHRLDEYARDGNRVRPWEQILADRRSGGGYAAKELALPLRFLEAVTEVVDRITANSLRYPIQIGRARRANLKPMAVRPQVRS
jgi:hypothetical protein